MNTVLVTGASGFIGSHLTEVLVQRGYTVKALVRPTSNTRWLRGLDLEVLTGSLSDARFLGEAIRGVDTVFHLAARTAAPTLRQLLEVNERGTQAILDAAAQAAPQPVCVLMSSIAAGGPAPPGHAKVESEPPEPISNYGLSKRAGEKRAEAMAARIPISIVRPGIVFGPRDPELLRAFRVINRFGVHPIPGFRPPQLSLIEVADLLELVIEVAERGERLPRNPSERRGQGIYHACHQQRLDYREMGEVIGHALGKKRVHPLFVPWPVPWVAGAVSEWTSRLFGQSTVFGIDKIREAQVQSWAYSAEKATRSLGFHPQNRLPEQFAQTAQWYRQHSLL